MEDLVIRAASLDDAADVSAIYAPYVENTAATFEAEDAPPGEAEIRARIAAVRKAYPWIVAVREGAVVGFAYAHAYRERAAYAHCAEVSIYVDGERRGCGVGRALYGELERQLAAQGVYNLYACVATTQRANDPNLTDASPRFHERLGYTAVGTMHRCGFKFGRYYDITWMEKILER